VAFALNNEAVVAVVVTSPPLTAASLERVNPAKDTESVVPTA
jgi:hypothetical protein